MKILKRYGIFSSTAISDEDVIDNAINEFKDTVMSLEGGSEYNRARKNFIDKLDMACEFGAITVPQAREISTAICRLEREESEQRSKRDIEMFMGLIDDAMRLTPDELRRLRAQCMREGNMSKYYRMVKRYNKGDSL